MMQIIKGNLADCQLFNSAAKFQKVRHKLEGFATTQLSFANLFDDGHAYQIASNICLLFLPVHFGRENLVIMESLD